MLLLCCVTHLALKLDADHVGLHPVRLPVGVGVVVTKQLHAIAWLCRADSPHGQAANLAGVAVFFEHRGDACTS